LTANAEGVGAFVGQRIYTDDYHAEVKMTGNNKVAAGFGLIGDEKNAIVLSVKDKKISIVATQNGKDSVVHVLPNQPQKLQVRMSVKRGNEVTFSYSTDGKSFKTLNEKPFDAYFLPPWDRAVRVALFSKGDSPAKAVFDDFLLINH
jgi:xylan 1,4-beta-xylosidase